MALLSLIVRKRDGIVFKGDALSISSINDKGTFDILPMHTNFVSTVRDSLWIREEHGKTLTISMTTGIIHVKENKVEIYVGI